jgi:preprotein translocase subunit SecA
MMRMKEDDIIESAMVSKQIEKAQRKVEAHNFDIRKNLLDYDDVNNDQRKVIYQQRDELLESDSVQETVESIRNDVFAELVRQHVPDNSVDEQWNLPGLERVLADEFGIQADLQGYAHGTEEVDAAALSRHAQGLAAKYFSDKEQDVGPEMMRALEKHVMLNILDQNWKEHLARMDYLRQGIHLRGFAQKQPKQEFKRESFELFSEMLEKFKREVTTILARVRVSGVRPKCRQGRCSSSMLRRAATVSTRKLPSCMPSRSWFRCRNRSCARVRRSVETTHVRAAPGKSTSNAMASWSERG